MAETQAIKTRLKDIGDIFWGGAARDLSSEERQALKAEERELLLEYMENLVHVPVSRCPYCQETLEVALDPGGLDGPWWWTTCPVPLPEHHSCEHFQVFLGAMDLHGRTPTEATENVMLGPAKPYVIDRLLSMEDMKAVLSEFTTDAGDRINLIAYFSESPVPIMELHQEWRHDKYGIPDDDGVIRFSEAKYDPWDFDLPRWHETGKLFWIAPGDADLELRDSAPEPFLDRTGTEMNQKVADGELELWEAPQGQRNAMYERP